MKKSLVVYMFSTMISYCSAMNIEDSKYPSFSKRSASASILQERECACHAKLIDIILKHQCRIESLKRALQSMYEVIDNFSPSSKCVCSEVNNPSADYVIE